MFAAGCLTLCMMTHPDACLTSSRCYVLIFGGIAARYRPNTAHTWATFACCNGDRIEHFTISWLPADGKVKPFGTAVEGRNYGLHETLELYKSERAVINLWGPFEIRRSFFEDAQKHKERLDSGEVLYKVMDGGPVLRRSPVRRPDLSHCVHAITRCNEKVNTATNPVLSWGGLITRRVANKIDESGYFINPDVTHDWMLEALDLQEKELNRRKLHEPFLKLTFLP